MSEALRTARRLRAGSRGYNMIEVMMGLTILAVGASGVIALQKVTVLGVTEGRNITAATNVAIQHLEAVRADGAAWNTGTDLGTGESPLVDALFAAPGTWIKPQGVAGFELGLSDVTGHTGSTSTTVPGPIAYCTQMRAVLIGSDADGPLLLRIEARTFWAKSSRDIRAECDAAGAVTNMNTGLGGGAITVGGVNYRADDYGWVFLTTSLRRNTLPR